MTETKTKVVSLGTEYNRVICSQTMEKLGQNLNGKLQYELHNILERWLISYANAAVDATAADATVVIGGDPVFGLCNPIQQIDDKYMAECAEKNIKLPVENLHKIMQRFCAQRGEYDDEPVIKDATVIYRNFRQQIPRERLAVMQKLGSTHDIAACAMRYASMLPRGQQWSLPAQFYETAFKKYGATIEGFASPFNSQVMMIGGKFCSLFLDTDAVFGGIGNFFTQKFTDEIIVVNPPFVPSILDHVAETCLGYMVKDGAGASGDDSKRTAGQEAKSPVFIIIVPHWKDTRFINILDAYARDTKSWSYECQPGKYVFEHTGKKILAKFPSKIYVVGSPGTDYSELSDSIAV